jgi:hypothetical protein
VIAGVAFVPHPPILVPDLAAGAAGELTTLRTACGQALEDIFAVDPDLVVVLGPAPEDCEYPRDATGSLRAYGVDVRFSLGAGGDIVLPLAHTVAAYLLGQRSALAVAFGVGPDFASAPAGRHLRALVSPGRVALIVVGDGSARRSRTAPGYFDERAQSFDAAIAAALRSGSASRLAALDVELGDELLAAGTRTWKAVAEVLSTEFRPRIYYDEAPYGVGYFVASWLPA